MPAHVKYLLAEVAAAIRADADSFGAGLVEVILRDIPELDGDRAIVDLLAQSVADNVANVLRMFQSGLDPNLLDAPVQAVEYARRLAQRGTPLSALLRAYRLGQAAFQERMIQGIGVATHDNDVIVAASLQISSVSFGYVDHVSEQIVAAYQAERDRWMRNRVATRTARVMSLLQGQHAGPAPTEVLGYPLGGGHVGAIIWTDERLHIADPLSRLERAVGELAAQLKVIRAPLFIAPDESTIWAWFAPSSPTATPLGTAEEGVLVAFGEPGCELEGFRATHRQAQRAQAVAMAAGSAHRRGVTRYAEAGLVELMCHDLDALRDWIAHTLGGLAADDPEAARLRHTVREFLASGGSFSAAGDALRLHRNTVQYRIKKAEKARGRALQEGRRDVEVALHVIDCLGSPALPGSGQDPHALLCAEHNVRCPFGALRP